MRKIILLASATICTLFLTQLSEFADGKMDIMQSKAPDYINSDGTNFVPEEVNYQTVDELESMLFQKKYTKEPLEMRLSRIEKKMFGMTQQNSNYSARLDKLMAASSVITGKPGSPEYWSARRNQDIAKANSYNSYAQDPYSSYNYGQGQQNQSKLREKFSQIGSILKGGQLTGYTPPISQDPYQYAPQQGMQYGQYGNGQNQPAYYSTNNNQNYNPYTGYRQQSFSNAPYLPPYANSGNRSSQDGQYLDVFSNSGGEQYNSRDGYKDNGMGSTGGGMGVKIIY